MGVASFFYHIWDTIVFIKDNGWAEYREARRRYDNHARLQGYGKAKFSKVKAIKNANRLSKVKK